MQWVQRHALRTQQLAQNRAWRERLHGLLPGTTNAPASQAVDHADDLDNLISAARTPRHLELQTSPSAIATSSSRRVAHGPRASPYRLFNPEETLAAARARVSRGRNVYGRYQDAHVARSAARLRAFRESHMAASSDEPTRKPASPDVSHSFKGGPSTPRTDQNAIGSGMVASWRAGRRKDPPGVSIRSASTIPTTASTHVTDSQHTEEARKHGMSASIGGEEQQKAVRRVAQAGPSSAIPTSQSYSPLRAPGEPSERRPTSPHRHNQDQVAAGGSEFTPWQDKHVVWEQMRPSSPLPQAFSSFRPDSPDILRDFREHMNRSGPRGYGRPRHLGRRGLLAKRGSTASEKLLEKLLNAAGKGRSEAGSAAPPASVLFPQDRDVLAHVRARRMRGIVLRSKAPTTTESTTMTTHAAHPAQSDPSLFATNHPDRGPAILAVELEAKLIRETGRNSADVIKAKRRLSGIFSDAHTPHKLRILSSSSSASKLEPKQGHQKTAINHATSSLQPRSVVAVSQLSAAASSHATTAERRIEARGLGSSEIEEVIRLNKMMEAMGTEERASPAVAAHLHKLVHGSASTYKAPHWERRKFDLPHSISLPANKASTMDLQKSVSSQSSSNTFASSASIRIMANGEKSSPSFTAPTPGSSRGPSLLSSGENSKDSITAHKSRRSASLSESSVSLPLKKAPSIEEKGKNVKAEPFVKPSYSNGAHDWHRDPQPSWYAEQGWHKLASKMEDTGEHHTVSAAPRARTRASDHSPIGQVHSSVWFLEDGTQYWRGIDFKRDPTKGKGTASAIRGRVGTKLSSTWKSITSGLERLSGSSAARANRFHDQRHIEGRHKDII
ncbi:hypothetical protein CBOM_04814 [Ceraceosorus bombacis]|uniref:Uncharacterized protein n=1 Tax=Ceraceosorus bombacis TaxID=401625 RepID=A0A0P1BR71_9BASI|nr:hypothetical protein CBOM_04814 [Ceraceosorus bombacis]